MKRQSLKNMTDEEKRAYKNAQAAERMRKKRDREKPARDCQTILRELEREIEKEAMSRTNWPVADLTEELEEFADELLKRRLEVAALALATWEHRNRLIFPRVEYLGYPVWEQGVARDEYARRRKLQDRWRAFGLIRLYASDALQRVANRESMKAHKAKEKADAAALDMSVDAYRLHKRRLRKGKETEKFLQRHGAKAA